MRKNGYLLGGIEAASNFTYIGKSALQIANQLSEMSGSHYHYDDNLNPAAECVNGTSANYYDTEPDFFYYNFAGHTGKFMMGIDKKMKFVPYKNYKAGYTLDNSPDPAVSSKMSYGIREFRITDEMGHQYIFANADTTAYYIRSNPFPSNCTVGWPPHTEAQLAYRYFSSWYLSKIITATGDEVNFNYTLEKVDMVSRTLMGRDIMDTNSDIVSDSDNRIWANRLTSIETRFEKLVFSADFARWDLYNSKALTAIEVYAKENGSLIFKKKLEFNYTYFESAEEEVPASNWGVYVPDNGGDLFKRLKLNSVREVSGGIAKAPYEFSYSDILTLPHRHSNQRDFWGYFTQNSGEYPYPALYVYPHNAGPTRLSVFPLYGYSGPEYHIAGQNRFANPNIVSGWTLTNIKFPTGGYTSFEFESHDFFYNTINRYGGGLRLKKTVTKDCADCAGEITKIYTYRKSSDTSKSSGLLLSIPSFAHTENSCGYFARAYGGDVWPYTFSKSSEEYFKYFTVKTDHSKSTLGADEGINVGYTEIKEEIVGSGYNIRTFGVPGAALQVHDHPGSFCDTAMGGYCDGLYETPSINYVQGYHLIDAGPSGCTGPRNYTSPMPFDALPDVDGMDFGLWSYPFVPNTNYDWNRGLLLRKKTYSNNNKIVSDQSYKYRVYYPSTGIAYIPAVNFVNSNNHRNLKTQNGTAIYEDELYIYSKYRLMADVCKLPSQIIERTIDQNDTSKYVETKTDYFYDNPTYASVTRTQQTDSKGDVLVSEKKYSYNRAEINAITPLQANAQAALDSMVARNIIAGPVYEEVTRNGSHNSSSLTNFRIWDIAKKVIMPEDIYFRLEAQPGETAVRFNGYDGYGNLLSQSEPNDIPVSYIWGYNSQYPVAQIANASPSEVYYDSFEGTNGTSDPNAKTGGRSYTGDLSLSFALPATNRPYGLTYWFWNGAAWQFMEKNYSGPTNITDGTKIDEVRIYPRSAFMTTFTYEPLIGVTSQCSENDIVTYYEYDALGRLKTLRDMNRSILKRYDYQYRVPTHNNPVWEYTNERRCVVDGNMENTGEEEVKQIDTNPNSSTYNTVRWLNIGVSWNCPITVYAKISYENIYTTFNETYADVAISFWRDAAGVTPVVPSVPVGVNYEKRQVDQYGNDLGFSSGANANCSYQNNVVEYNMPVWLDWFTGYDPTGLRYKYIVNPGVGYQLAN